MNVMPSEETYRYDLFISYSSADRSWAEKLSNSLEDKGRKPCFDRTSLRAGENWEFQLLGELNTSQHLVVLWSERANQSDWVRRELSYFDAAINNPIPGRKTPSRRIIFLLLDREHTAFRLSLIHI